MNIVKGARVTVAATVCVVSLSILFTGMTRLAARPQQERQPLPTVQERQQAEALRRQSGIRAAAAIYGRYVSTGMFEDFAMAQDVSVLVERSEVVLRGKVVNNLSHLSADGKDIVSDYQVKANEVLKGRIKKEDVVNVRLPGGRVEFENGTFADIKIADLRRPANDSEYLFFLAETRDEGHPDRTFQLVLGSQGLFELTSHGLASGLGNSRMAVQRKYDQQAAAVLLNDVRDAVAQRKGPSDAR